MSLMNTFSLRPRCKVRKKTKQGVAFWFETISEANSRFGSHRLRHYWIRIGPCGQVCRWYAQIPNSRAQIPSGLARTWRKFFVFNYLCSFISPNNANTDSLYYSTDQSIPAPHRAHLRSTFCSRLGFDQFEDILKSRLCEHIVFGSVNQICGSTAGSVDSP